MTISEVGTGSRLTRIIGVAAVGGLALLLLYGLVISGPEVTQRDAVRLFYVHVPTVLVAYAAFLTTLVGSVIYLRRGSQFWDLVAGAAAEIGVLFCGFALATGSLWGKPTWGVYWTWDPRLTSTTVLFLLYVGYLAIRRLDLDPVVRSRRAAIVGIISFFNVIIVHYSVQWWNGLHQGQTFGVDTQLDGSMLLSFFIGVVTFMLIGSWLLIHRFRVAWLEYVSSQVDLDDAIEARRGEGSGYSSSGDLARGKA